MTSLFYAEWLKITGHRWAAGLLIWLFPIGAAVIVVIGILTALFFPNAVEPLLFFSPPEEWLNQIVNIWNITRNPLARLLLMGFAAIIMAGEYQWRTWKNIIPYRGRASLILIKFLALGIFITTAFATMSVVWGIGMNVILRLVGVNSVSLLINDTFSEFSKNYIITASLAFTSVIISAGYVALGAVLTRSIIGAALIGLVVTIVEEISPILFLLISRLTNSQSAGNLYRLTPTFSLNNVNSWVNNNSPFMLQGLDFSAVNLSFSIIVLLAWVLGLILLAMLLFQRQDITS